MSRVSLGSLLFPRSVRAGEGSVLPVYSVTKHSGFVPSLEYFSKQVFSRDLSTYRVVESGDFAYASIHLDEGSIGIAPERALVSPMYTVFSVDHNLVEPRYLLRLLKSRRALSLYGQLGSGAVHRRKTISLSALGALAIDLPPLAEQRRVAALFDHAEELSSHHEKLQGRIAELSSTAFERTVDPSAEPVRLKSLGVSFIAGRNVVSNEVDGHPNNRVLKVSAVSSGEFRAEESKPLPANYTPPETHLVSKGDVLFGRASGSVGLVGATAIVDVDVDNLYMPDKLWRLELAPSSPISLPYAAGLLNAHSTRAYIRANVTGSTGVYNISKSKLLNYEVAVPSNQAQRSFEETEVRLRALRASSRAQLRHASELFHALENENFTRIT